MTYDIFIERVQKEPTNLVSGLKKCSYDDRMKKLGITTLNFRRLCGDMTKAFKLLT